MKKSFKEREAEAIAWAISKQRITTTKAKLIDWVEEEIRDLEDSKHISSHEFYLYTINEIEQTKKILDKIKQLKEYNEKIDIG